MFGIKMTDEEIKMMKERARRLGLSASGYMRFLLHRELQSRRKEDFSLTRE